MFCQACQKVMPFKRRDGEWYFEAIPFVGGRKKVHRANALALCPCVRRLREQACAQ